MQIDGHHTLTYVVCRLAGMSHPEAHLVAYSAEYVDEATNGGAIGFDNGAMYHRISSAHKMLDYRNSLELANHQVWIPFHFLPGNGGMEAGTNPEGNFIDKLICRPDSPPARDMLKGAVSDKNKPYALFRLGIALHVYADTFAHQGFAGVIHKVNEVSDIEIIQPQKDESLFDKISSYFVNETSPLGHGASLSYPDRPYLKWNYIDGLGHTVSRDNHQIFCDAADAMCRAIQCYLEGDVSMSLEAQSGLPEADSNLISDLLLEFDMDDGEERHEKWLEVIAQGAFSFGSENIEFIPKGIGSWKHEAIGQEKSQDDEDEKFEYKPAFLQSNWKLFHDALQAHRFDVLHNILPKYGICAA
ncbi:DUF6765 family protein [Ferrimonas sp. SCSIO 43195]|uniref:DUF6765 family protein n=1 Tax=Ferrimonas sp. SCSIO 43195 TaxID=2822844 RepID=UPI0020760FDC|nr:DUF6765 family protein [Ferrimonas sp. SCSIO 43195]USD38431.1 hypothetical protein J8Z22_04635 [Ferrimonas sp. SCSIO 43195]